MGGRTSLLLYVTYAMMAVLAIYYSLFVRHSIMIAFIAFHLVTCLGIPVIHGLMEGRLKVNWQAIAIKRPVRMLQAVAAGIGSGIILFAGVMAGFYLLLQTGVQPAWIRQVLASWGLTEDWLWLFVIYMTVGNSFFEELLWRGFMLPRLCRYVPWRRAVLLSSFFFCSYHLLIGVALFGWKWGIIVALLAWGIGCFWAVLTRAYQGMLAAWLSHLLVDLGLMVSLLNWVMEGK